MATDAGGYSIKVNVVTIVKTTTGTVVLKDDTGAVLFTTGSLSDGSMTHFPMYGIEMMGLEYDAVSAGSAVVTVLGRGGSKLAIRKN